MKKNIKEWHQRSEHESKLSQLLALNLKAEHLDQHDVCCTIPNDVITSLNLNQT